MRDEESEVRKPNSSRAVWMTGLLAVVLALFPSGICLAGAGDGEDDGRKFDSRPRLERTVLLQDRQELAGARDSLETARAALERAIEAEAPQEIIDRLEAEVERREAQVEDGQREIRRVQQLIQNLSDEQVFAFNRALNSAIQSGLIGDLDAQTLKRALGADLDRQQINAVSQALEQEARFLQKADRFRELADSSGEERFLRQAARAEAKAEREREKFLARVRTDAHQPNGEERTSLRAQARSVGQEEARRHAHQLAHENALELAKAVALEELRRNRGRDGAGLKAAKEAKHAAKEVKSNRGRSLAREKKNNNGG